MSKIIRMTPEMIEESKRKFGERLKSINLTNGTLSYTETFSATGQKATIWFTPDAYTKMIALIQDSDKEVAWHGVAHRLEEVGHYAVTDILVYPQEVSGATVNTDQAEYEQWMNRQEDDIFYNIRFQGHSHVMMDTFASATDLEHQAKIVQQLEGDMFYIFMIWNKKFKYTAKIYDLKINTLFEPGDISVAMVGASCGLSEFLKEARSMVKTKTYQPQGTYQGGNYYGGYQGSYQNNKPATTSTPTTQSKPVTAPANASGSTEKKDEPASTVPSRPKTCIGNGWAGAGRYDYDDDDDPYGKDGRFCH